jgi:pimeloyl-ACP methyl ester carboxylesterase
MSAAINWFFETVQTPNIKLIVGSSVATTLVVITITRLALQSTPRKTIPSPRDTLIPKLSKAEQDDLPYPPDAFPGARDVASPYGTIRVYEWGPEVGRKVLLIHGISTPCVALGGVAQGLVEKGCRVMLMDLWGRGYSDSVDLPHDSRLYTTEILLAITSSLLAWTGSDNGFSLIGYSLGGGISADFASCFPDMVKSVVLLAPAGLIRPHHFVWQSRLMYSTGIIPDSWLRWIVRRRLQSRPVHSTVHKRPNVEDTVKEEIKGKSSSFENAPLSKSRPGVTVASAVQWQVENHVGFVNSFMSSIRFASITGKQETWKKLGLRKDKIMIIAGTTDAVIVQKELEADASVALGADKVEWKVLEGGHDFPITSANKVVQEVSGFWGI